MVFSSDDFVGAPTANARRSCQSSDPSTLLRVNQKRKPPSQRATGANPQSGSNAAYIALCFKFLNISG